MIFATRKENDMKKNMKEITSIEEFEEVYQKEGVHIFTFSADWCADCRFIEAFIPALIEKYSKYHFYYLDRDRLMPICQRLMIMGIPSFVAIKDGKEIGRFVSKLRKTEDQIDQFLESLQSH